MPNNRGARGKTNWDSFSDGRIAWTSVEGVKFVLYLNRPDDYPDDDTPKPLGPHDNVSLSIHKSKQRFPTTINLTHLTRPELDALKQVVDLAFATAAPIVDALDAKAEELKLQGDDSIVRLYRAVPDVHVRERLQPKHDPGLPE